MEDSRMPHCSLEFSRIGLLVAVHSQWNIAQTNCALRIFTSRPRADDFLAVIPHAERRGFAKCAAILESDADALGVLELRGDTALSLTSFFVKLRWEVHVSNTPPGPLLMGFWGPPATREFGDGMIMWFHPDSEYHAAIVHNREQAEKIMCGLSWLQEERRERLLEQIKTWKMLRQSADVLQEIGGVIAEVLAKASLAAKVSNVQKAAMLN